MRGSVIGLAQALYRLSEIVQIGYSKHRAKELAKTWHEMGKRLGTIPIQLPMPTVMFGNIFFLTLNPALALKT